MEHLCGNEKFSAMEHTSISSHPGSHPRNYDLQFKVAIVGNAGVGKTTFLKTYLEGAYRPGVSANERLDVKSKEIVRQGKIISLQFWDTAGTLRIIRSDT